MARAGLSSRLLHWGAALDSDTHGLICTLCAAAVLSAAQWACMVFVAVGNARSVQLQLAPASSAD